MGTAIVVAIVSGVVSLGSVLANAFITIWNVRAETSRARESREAEDRRTREGREAEDRRLREEREAEAQRRDQEAATVAARAERSDREARANQRWDAVRTAVETEASLRADPGRWSVVYALKLQGLSLLTHADEVNLRAALLQRAALADQPFSAVQANVKQGWWHPWVSRWAANPDEPMVFGEADEGRVF